MSDIPLLPQVEAFLRRNHTLFIDGGYVESHSSQRLEVINPSTGQVIAASARGARIRSKWRTMRPAMSSLG